MQTESDGSAPGDNYTVLRGAPRRAAQLATSARSFSRGSRPANSTRPQRGRRRRRELPVLPGAQHQLVSSRKSATPGDVGRRDRGQGVGHVERQLRCTRSTRSSPSATTSATTSAIIKRIGVRKHFVDFGVRPRPGGRAQDRHPRAAPAHAATTSTPISRTSRSATPTTWRWPRSSSAAGTSSSQWNPRYERITEPFNIRPDQSFAPGEYSWNEYALELETDHSRKISGSALLTTGGFWNGTQKSSKVGRASSGRRITSRSTPHCSATTSTLPFPMHPFVTNLITSRIGYAFNTRTFLDTLLQYNSDLQAVQRQRPLRSDPSAAERPVRRLQRTAADRSNNAANTGRGLIVKYTHMLAF